MNYSRARRDYVDSGDWGIKKKSSSWQATWGKRLGLTPSLLRTVLKFAPWELTHACLWRIPGWPLATKTISPIIQTGLALVWVIAGVYVLSLLISKRQQTLYDWLAGAYVRKRGFESREKERD